jgi:hypothetical protein
MKKQGKVKTIVVKEVITGMQILDKFGNIGIVLPHTTLSFIPYKITCRDSIVRENSQYIEELRVIVVEYDRMDPKGGLGHTVELPLKHSQWQAAIDKGEVDSDKVVMFEVLPGIICEYAKIIPQKEKEQTWDEIRDYAYNVWEKNGGLSKFEDWYINWLEDQYLPPKKK